MSRAVSQFAGSDCMVTVAVVATCQLHVSKTRARVMLVQALSLWTGSMLDKKKVFRAEESAMLAWTMAPLAPL